MLFVSALNASQPLVEFPLCKFYFWNYGFPPLFPYERDGLNTLEISAIIGTVSLGFILGLYDDLRNSPVIAKFIIQFLIAFILIFAGVYIQLFENDYLNYALTVFWVVGIMNSINMLIIWMP